MARFDPFGKYFIHLIIITFGLIGFIIFKNFNFSDYEKSPILTTLQINVIYALVLIGFVTILIFMGWGFTKKTPRYYWRAGIAVIFIWFGLVMILYILFSDLLLGYEQDITPNKMLVMLMGCFLTIMGTMAYISVKFPDTEYIKHFKAAVREEIQKQRKYEQDLALWKAQQRRMKKRKKVKQVKSKQKKKKQKIAKSGVKEVVMTPADDVTVVKCAKCQRSLKLSTNERPIIIKCPFCEAIGVIKE